MRTRDRLVVLLLAAVVGAAAPTDDLTVSERSWIRHWLECQECVNHELDSVRAIARRKPVETIAYLAGFALNGPPPDRRLEVTQQLRSAYVRDTAFAHAGGIDVPAIDDTLQVATSLIVFDRTYRFRAATALGWIGTPAADSVLDAVWRGSHDEQVRAVVRSARDRRTPQAPRRRPP